MRLCVSGVEADEGCCYVTLCRRCGSGSVVLMWEVTAQLITVTGDVCSFYLDSTAHIVQDIDCVRLIGDTKHHILYKVLCILTAVYAGPVHPICHMQRPVQITTALGAAD